MPPEESTLDSGLVIRLIVCMAVNCQFVPFVIRNHPWLAASVLHGLLLLLAVVLLPIGYGVCDDVIIEWLIANDFSGWWYTGQLHPCLSFALGWVWEKLPGIAWYSLFAYGMTYVSWIMICGGMFRAINSYGNNSPSNATLLYAIAGGGSLFFACDAYLYMQYTQLALTLLLAGVTCLVFPFSQRAWLSYICGILFVLLGLAWREKSIYILYPFLTFQLIRFLYKCYRRQCPWRSIGKWVTVFVVVTLAFGSLHMLQDKILQENGMLKRSYENIDLQGRSRHYGIGRDAVDHTEIKCMEFSASPGIASFVICLHRKGCRACTLWNISDGICFFDYFSGEVFFYPCVALT